MTYNHPQLQRVSTSPDLSAAFRDAHGTVAENNTIHSRLQLVEAHSPAPGDLDDGDPFRIANGFSEMNRDAFDSMKASDQKQGLSDRHLEEDRRRKKEEADEAYERHLERVREWENTVVMWGGMQTTNAEIQDTLHKMLERADETAEDAVKKGLIKKGEEEEYKRTLEEMHRLRELQKNNQMNDEQRRRLAEIERSRMGQVIINTSAQRIEANRSLNNNNLESEYGVSAKETAGMNTGLDLAPKDLQDPAFKNAPAVNEAFKTASSGMTVASLDSALDDDEPVVQPKAKVSALTR